MGAGGNLAHGCNIGHALTGLPLLSFGSLLATAAIVAGSLLTWRLMLERPATATGTRKRRDQLTAGQPTWSLGAGFGHRRHAPADRPVKPVPTAA